MMARRYSLPRRGGVTRIAWQRRQTEMTQAELAKTVGISVNQLGRLERGDEFAELPMLRRLAAALGISAAELLEPADNPWLPHKDEKELLDRYRRLFAPLQRDLLNILRALTGGQYR